MKHNGVFLYKAWVVGEAMVFLSEGFFFGLLLIFSVGALIARGQNEQALADFSHASMNSVLIVMALLFLLMVILVVIFMYMRSCPWMILWIALFTSGLSLLVIYDLNNDLNTTLNLSFAVFIVFALGNVIRTFARGMFDEWMERQIYLFEDVDRIDFSCDGLKISCDGLRINPELRSFFNIIRVQFVTFEVPIEQLNQNSISSTQPMKKADVVLQAKNRFLFLKPEFRLCVNYYTYLLESKEMEILNRNETGI